MLITFSIKINFVSNARVFVNNYIHDSKDDGRIIMGIFLDVKKAFDNISHEILLNKLKLCWSAWYSN